MLHFIVKINFFVTELIDFGGNSKKTSAVNIDSYFGGLCLFSTHFNLNIIFHRLTVLFDLGNR